MATMRRQGLDVHLRAVGPFESPTYAAEVAARVRRLGLNRHVTWTGFTRDVSGEVPPCVRFQVRRERQPQTGGTVDPLRGQGREQLLRLSSHPIVASAVAAARGGAAFSGRVGGTPPA